MKTKDRPLESHTAVISSFLDLADLQSNQKKLLKTELKTYIETRIQKGKWCHPMITKFHTDWYREFYRLIDNTDPYENIKEMSNEQAKEIIEKSSPKTIKEKIMLTIIGNRIDFGACVDSIYDLKMLEKDVANASQEILSIDDTDELLEKIKKAKNVFYLFDNNGEMIFDTLLLDYICKFVDKKNIFLVGKSSPMLNDVVVDDLKRHGLDNYGEIVSTGSNCFGLHEEDVSEEFKKIFKNADLIIAKGQAYFEFFMEYDFDNVMHILRVKHEIKGNNVPTLKANTNIVMSSKKYCKNGVGYKWI